MRTRFAAWFLTLPLLAAPALAQGDPLQEPFTGNFSSTPLSVVLDAVHESTKLNVVLDRSVDPATPITANANRLAAGQFLALVERGAGLERATWCGALVLHAKGRAPGAEPQLPAGEALDARATLAFDSTPFLFAIERLRTRSSLELELTPRARAAVSTRGASVSLRVHRMQVKHLLAHLARAGDLTFTVTGNRATFDATGDAREVDAGTVELGPDALTPQVDISKLLVELKAPATRDGARRQLVAAGKPAAQPVADLLKEKDLDPAAAVAALQVLQQVGDASHGAVALGLFRDQGGSLDVRTEAGVTLGALRATDAVPALIDALDDEWFRIAETARGALVQIGEPAVATLAARWEAAAGQPTGHDGIAYRSLLVFGSIGTDRCKQLLVKALGTTQGPRAVPLRHHAAIGLGFTQDPKMIEPLMDALDRERQFLVASYIARSLTWITDQELPPQPGRWRVWWAQNKEKVLGDGGIDDLYEPLEVPTGPDGLPLLDTPGQR